MDRLIQSITLAFYVGIGLSLTQCSPVEKNSKTAAEILGNSDYQAISYGGYREKNRSIQPTLKQIKADLKIMYAVGVRILRTYNLQFDFAPNVLKAITELKADDPNFEMYVMLGTWIDCENAWTDSPNHDKEDLENNTSEIDLAVKLANNYPDIVKVIAVGNESMVHWAASYFVQPRVVLKWVNHLQALKKAKKLSSDLWITSSDNFASWGGGDASYHNDDLNALIKAVDFLSVHTYPFHDTHYNSSFWEIDQKEAQKGKVDLIEAAMERAHQYAINQYKSVASYVESLGIEKPIHIGETGWATNDSWLYGKEGTAAADEFKQALYYQKTIQWTNENGISCFFFEAFDEQWKDASNPVGSENHFGLITIEGRVKYALWDELDKGVFDGLGRNGLPVKKTFDGNKKLLLDEVVLPKIKQK